MIIKFKVFQEEAMAVMNAFLGNGYKPVMSATNSYPEFVIAIDTNDVENEEDGCKNSSPICKPDCPDFEECWGEVDEDTKEENEKAVEEFLNYLMKSMSESATKKSRILNE